MEVFSKPTYQSVAANLTSGPNEPLFNNLVTNIFNNMEGTVVCDIDDEHVLIIGCLGAFQAKPGLFIGKHHSDNDYIRIAELPRWRPVYCDKNLFSFQLEKTIDDLVSRKNIQRVGIYNGIFN